VKDAKQKARKLKRKHSPDEADDKPADDVNAADLRSLLDTGVWVCTHPVLYCAFLIVAQSLELCFLEYVGYDEADFHRLRGPAPPVKVWRTKPVKKRARHEGEQEEDTNTDTYDDSGYKPTVRKRVQRKRPRIVKSDESDG